MKISDFCHTGSGGTPSRSKIEYYENGSIPWFKSGELNESYLFESEEKITETALKESAANIVPKGSVLIAMYGATVGKTSILGIDATTNQAICHLVPDSKRCNNLFLQYFLRSQMNTLLSKRVGGAQPNINQNIVKNLEIDIPPLPEQIHIANVLSRAEAMITKRKESLALLDAYLKSTFLELFGDPVRNEKGWEVTSLINFGSFKNGLNYNSSESGFRVRTLGVGDFKSASKLTDIRTLSFLNLSTKPPEDYLLKDGDLIFVRSNGNRELVGRCLVIYPNNEEVTFSGFCIRYRPTTNSINSTYLAHLFRVTSFKTIMLQNGRGANISNINQKILEDLKIPFPPVPLQNQFAAVVEKVEALKERYQESLRELEALYGALSQRAFRGELGG
ncbi:restriction endonuclease subunit S [Leptospira bourretii]|uniref:restriction endonuclease subunit S n=1 Tax=Leptospira bourretii TaxID=2484962 RepID=UPI00142E3E5E|nr:restriction endonuclease subunit S [Leptospira bourretii]